MITLPSNQTVTSPVTGYVSAASLALISLRVLSSRMSSYSPSPTPSLEFFFTGRYLYTTVILVKRGIFADVLLVVRFGSRLVDGCC